MPFVHAVCAISSHTLISSVVSQREREQKVILLQHRASCRAVKTTFQALRKYISLKRSHCSAVTTAVGRLRCRCLKSVLSGWQEIVIVKKQVRKCAVHKLSSSPCIEH